MRDIEFSDLPGSLKRIASVLLAILENRVELFAVEAREQQYHFMRLALLLGAFLFFGMVSVLLIIATIVYALEPESRMVALIVITAVFVVVALSMAVMVKGYYRKHSTPFSQTLAEIKKDRNSFNV